MSQMSRPANFAPLSVTTTCNCGWSLTVQVFGCLGLESHSAECPTRAVCGWCSDRIQLLDCPNQVTDFGLNQCVAQNRPPYVPSAGISDESKRREAAMKNRDDLASILRGVHDLVMSMETKLFEAGTILYHVRVSLEVECSHLQKNGDLIDRCLPTVTRTDVRSRLSRARLWLREARSDISEAKAVLETVIQRRLAARDFDLLTPSIVVALDNFEKSAQPCVDAGFRYLDSVRWDASQLSMLCEATFGRHRAFKPRRSAPVARDGTCDRYATSLFGFGEKFVGYLSVLGTLIRDAILGPSTLNMAGHSLDVSFTQGTSDVKFLCIPSASDVIVEYADMKRHPVWVQKMMSKRFVLHPEEQLKHDEVIARRDRSIAKRDEMIFRIAEFEKAVNDFRLVIGGFNISVLSVMKERSCAA